MSFNGYGKILFAEEGGFRGEELPVSRIISLHSLRSFHFISREDRILYLVFILWIMPAKYNTERSPRTPRLSPMYRSTDRAPQSRPFNVRSRGHRSTHVRTWRRAMCPPRFTGSCGRIYSSPRSAARKRPCIIERMVVQTKETHET